MRLFPFIYASVYMLMHIYIIFKAKAALKLGFKSTAFFLFFAAIMVAFPIIVRLSDISGDIYFPRREAVYSSFLWMGFILQFCFVLAVYDIYTLLVKGLSRLTRKSATLKLLLPVRRAFIILLLASIALVIYGRFEAKNIVTERITIYTDKLPHFLDKLRVVQISDVHLGILAGEETLNSVIEKVIEAAPDLLVATGDIVDGRINHDLELIEPFRRINPKYGKYAVLGNHEFYVGIEQAVDFLENAGFKVLRGEAVTIDGLINIAGVDDPVSVNFDRLKLVSERETLLGLPSGRFTIFLKHRPEVKPDYLGLFDLQLSGHSHRGQILPLNLITKFYYPVHGGFAKLPNNSYLYVSRGSGTSGPPIRILSPPEITVIEIVRVQGQ
jgi:predicted MPP superfamily phosphohydrolase